MLDKSARGLRKRLGDASNGLGMLSEWQWGLVGAEDELRDAESPYPEHGACRCSGKPKQGVEGVRGRADARGQIGPADKSGGAIT